MSRHRIVPEPLLAPATCSAIDAFGAAHRGTVHLPAWAAFLRSATGVTLELDPDIVGGFATDSSNLPGTAQALARPATALEAAAVLRACRAGGMTLTVSGGKSSLTGSATAEGGVVLSTSRLLALPDGAPLAVDATARTVVAPAGLILEDMRQAVLARTGGRLAYPVDPTSRADATVGGTIACNASGFVPGPGGATRAWTEALDVLLPDGRLVRARRGAYVSRNGGFTLDDAPEPRAWPVPRYARPAVKNAGGPFSAPDGALDLVDLIVGSEGLFGLVTAGTLRLADRPAGTLDLFIPLAAEAGALRFLERATHHLRGNLGALGALEYFGVNSPAFMAHRASLYRPHHQVAVYLQVPLRDRTADAAMEEWLDVVRAADCGAEEDAILPLDNARAWTTFMEARHALPAQAIETAKHRGAFTIMTDTVVPPDRFGAFLEATHACLRERQLDYVSFGHLGDCHLHFTILPHRAQIDSAVAAYDAIVALSADLGGVYSGEHGTGKRKRQDFLRCYGAEAADQVRRCKAAVDPENLLNRGNVVEP